MARRPGSTILGIQSATLLHGGNILYAIASIVFILHLSIVNCAKHFYSDLYQTAFSLVIFRSLKNTYYFSTALIMYIYLFLLFYCPFTALLCFF